MKRPRKTAQLVGIALLALVLVACSKKTPEEMFQDAQTAAQRGDTIGAILKAQKIVKNYPDNPIAYQARLLMAASHVQNGEMESARNRLQEIIDGAGLKSAVGQQAFRNMVATYNMANDTAGAIAEIEEALPQLAEMPRFQREARVMLANFYQASEQPEKAQEILQAMLDKAETERDYLQATEQMVGMAVRQDKPEQALKLYDDFLKKYPDSENKALVLFGVGYFQNRMAEKTEKEDEKKQHEKAAQEALGTSLRLLDKRIDAELTPQRRMGLVDQKAKILMEMGKKDEAVKALIAFVDENPELEQRVIMLRQAVEMLLMQEKLDEAKEVLQRIARDFPNSQMGQQAGQVIAAIENKQAQAKMQAQTGGGATSPTQAVAPAAK